MFDRCSSTCIFVCAIRASDVFQIANKPFKKNVFADNPPDWRTPTPCCSCNPSNWTTPLLSYLARMEQTFPLFLAHEIVYAFPFLLSHHNGAGLYAVFFISRDCSMRFRSCYLTRMERALPLFYLTRLQYAFPLFISPEWSRPYRSFYLTRLYSLCVSALITSPKRSRPYSCFVTILEYKFLLLQRQVCGNVSLCRLE